MPSAHYICDSVIQGYHISKKILEAVYVVEGRYFLVYEKWKICFCPICHERELVAIRSKILAALIYQSSAQYH